MSPTFISPNDSLSQIILRVTEPTKLSDVSSLTGPYDRGHQVLIINVDIGDGLTDEIVIYEHDAPAELASAFCGKHDLSNEICKALELQMQAYIRQLSEDPSPYTDSPPVLLKHPYDSPGKGSESFYQMTYDELRAEIPRFSKTSFTDHVETSYSRGKGSSPISSQKQYQSDRRIDRQLELIEPEELGHRDLLYSGRPRDTSLVGCRADALLRVRDLSQTDLRTPPKENCLDYLLTRQDLSQTDFHAPSHKDRSVSSSPQKKKRNLKASLPGHRLYEKGMIMKKALQDAFEKKQKEREDQEVADLTFSPTILKPFTKDYNSNPGAKLATLTERLKTKEQKLKRLRNDIEMRELFACTFKPKLSEGTRELMQNRSLSKTECIDRLHNEAKELKDKRSFAEMQSIRSYCPFKPEIHETPTKVSKSANATPVKPRRSVSPVTLSETNCSFKPKTGRAPKVSRNTESMPIGSYLHTQKLKRESSDRLQQPTLTKCVSENSLKIIDKLRHNQYAVIFKAFCKDSSLDPEWDLRQAVTLDTDLVKVLTPFIEELATSGQKLDLSQFSSLLEQYAQHLSPIDKSTLYNTGKAPPLPKKHPFKPQISPYATSKFKTRAKMSLYNRLLGDQKTSKSKLEEAKARKIESELHECTFYPNTLEMRISMRAKPDDANPATKET